MEVCGHKHNKKLMRMNSESDVIKEITNASSGTCTAWPKPKLGFR